MANTFALGGSPLGLINVKSRTDRTGQSTFNAGKARNVQVFKYNKNESQATGIPKGSQEIYAPISMLSGGSLPRFFPNANVNEVGSDKQFDGTDKASSGDIQTLPGRGINANIHNDFAYDTSILNIIERLSKTKQAALRPQDFAYLKKLGVYPNNRLVIARRFPAPVGSSIFSKNGGPSPKAILITWKDDSEDFLEFNFGEEWTDADADFTNLLSRLGKDFGIENSGQGLSKALNLIPLPGFTETLQRQILEEMGVLESGSGNEPLPSGNPNLIKMAKRRKTIGYGEAGSGLKCSISVKMTCEYEQKFISGIDPTIAFQDIINNIIIFGTSNSSDYGLSKKFEKNIKAWSENPGLLVQTVIQKVKDAASSAINDIAVKGAEALKKLNDAIGLEKKQDVSADQQKEDNNTAIEAAKTQLNNFFKKIANSAFKTISKYKVEIMGIANALSGSPSTPYHVTIGNPLRPFFSCGDMYPSSEILLKFGPQLAFNDLPSSITVEFTLTNARPLGMQEILARFNSGHLRTVNIKKDFIEIPVPNDEEAAQKDLQGFNSSGADFYFDQVKGRDGNVINPPPPPPPPQTPTVEVQQDATLPSGQPSGQPDGQPVGQTDPAAQATPAGQIGTNPSAQPATLPEDQLANAQAGTQDGVQAEVKNLQGATNTKDNGDAVVKLDQSTTPGLDIQIDQVTGEITEVQTGGNLIQNNIGPQNVSETQPTFVNNPLAIDPTTGLPFGGF